MGTSGVYATDFNNDLRPDVLLLGGENPVLLENTANGFVETGLLPALDGTVRSALFFDATGDGTEDLLMLRMYDTPVLLENTENGYERAEMQLNISLDVPMGATAADFTGNGCLDLFIIQNGDLNQTGWRGSMVDHVPITQDNGQRNYLVTSDCESFSVSTNPVFNTTMWSLSTSTVDLTGNGWPDIHVANVFQS
ncbi:MAG: VCBS repeat-containing protein [Natrialbaceae archaeon]|nr:VCBS repeat-containing protein [Natrialbaceae archaeon]